MPWQPPAAPKCPKCSQSVFAAEKVSALGKDWHKTCLKCGKCGKTLANGSFLEHEGTPYCEKPCFASLFGPAGYGRGGGVESHKTFGTGQSELQKK